MFPLVDAGFVVVGPSRGQCRPGEGLVEGAVDSGILLQKPLVLGLVRAGWMASWRGGMHGS